MRSGEMFVEKSRSLENLHHLQLMALLRELMREHGRKETAEVLGIDPRTLDTCLERGMLSRRVVGELTGFNAPKTTPVNSAQPEADCSEHP